MLWNSGNHHQRSILPEKDWSIWCFYGGCFGHYYKASEKGSPIALRKFWGCLNHQIGWIWTTHSNTRPKLFPSAYFFFKSCCFQVLYYIRGGVCPVYLVSWRTDLVDPSSIQRFKCLSARAMPAMLYCADKVFTKI